MLGSKHGMQEVGRAARRATLCVRPISTCHTKSVVLCLTRQNVVAPGSASPVVNERAYSGNMLSRCAGTGAALH
jgi:hypothetical protein